MAHIADNSHQNNLFLLALLCSVALHGVAVAFLPGYTNDDHLPDDHLTVELLKPEPPPPPPPPVKEPEPPKPEPQKTKVVPVSKPVPTPPPRPVAQPVQQPPVAPPPVAEPPPQPIAVPQKAADPTPAVTVPVAPPPPDPVVEDTSAARAGYGRLLTSEFAKHKKYPQVARMRGWQGAVQIRLQVDADGNASNPVVEQSSGKEILDNQALETVHNSLPLPPPPAVLRGKAFSIVVPVVFRLESPS